MDRKTRIVLASLVVFSAFVLLALATYTTPRPGGLLETGTPVEARFSHTATLLHDGRVLIAGGMEHDGVWLDTAELWDPVTGRFTPLGRMTARRAGATATLLPNGKVLIAGGSDGPGSSLSTAEIFDPQTLSFTRTDEMMMRRAHAEAVLLRSGKVLVAGGSGGGDNDQTTCAEIYDPVTERFSHIGYMQFGRSYFTAVMLRDGRVLLAGGMSGGQYPNRQVESTAEIFDPSTGRFNLTGNLSTPRYKQGAALLPDGRVLVVGGSNETGRLQYEYSSTEIYNPESGRFTAGPSMNVVRFKLPSGVVTLGDGRILVAGGADQLEVFDPAKNAFLQVKGPQLEGFLFNTATSLSDGRVLLVDGYGRHPENGAIRKARVFTP